MAEIIALLIGFAVFGAIMRQREDKSWITQLEWELAHDIRAPCKDCEHDVYSDHETGEWRHMHNERATSKTPHGQPHVAYPNPFSREAVDKMNEEADRAEDAEEARWTI